MEIDKILSISMPQTILLIDPIL